MSPARSVAAIACASLFVAIVTARFVGGTYLASFNTPHTSLEGIAHARSRISPGPGLARRVVVVFLDGLRADVARDLPELEPLRRRGVFRPITPGFPTFTSPAIAAMSTGLTPRDSGLRLNGGVVTTGGLDTFVRAASDARVPLTIFERGFSPFGEILVSPAPASGERAPNVEVVPGRVALAARLAMDAAGLDPPAPIDGRHPTRDVRFVYVGEVDEAGHSHGAASPEYARAAHEAGELVARVALGLDLEQDALVVASDHGHLARGGHGGDEPDAKRAFFLLVGGPARRGVELEERPMNDVAPTLSALAGVRAPTSSLGRPMLDALALEDAHTSILAAPAFDAAARFACRVRPEPRCDGIDALVERLRRGEPDARADADALLEALTDARDRELAGLAATNARTRLAAISVLLTALLASGALAIRRARPLFAGVRASSIALPLASSGAYVAVLAARAYTPSFSRMKPSDAFREDAALASLSAVALVALVTIVARPGPRAGWVLLLATCVPFALLAAFVGADPALVPTPLAGILVFLLAPLVVASALGAVVVTGIEARRGA